MKKKLFSVALVGLLLAGPMASELLACCTGNWTICTSDKIAFYRDVERNCDGCTTGMIMWIVCDNTNERNDTNEQ